MRVKLSTRVPSSSGGVLARKASAAFAAAVASAGPRVAAIVRDRAATAVGKLAPEFARRYKAALAAPGAVTLTEKAVTIETADPVVVVVERGRQGWDMKPALLAHGKPSKDGGMYVDIPMTHKPGSVPQATRTAGRRAARSIGGVGTVRLPRTTPGRSFERAVHRGSLAQALGIGPKRQSVQHKRGVHDDVIRRSRRGPGGGTLVRYTTIRRISTRSPASAWWHPGFKARRVLDDVLPGARRDIAAALRAAVTEVRGAR